MNTRRLTTIVLTALALSVPAAPALAGPGPGNPVVHHRHCRITGFHDPNVFCRTPGRRPRISWQEWRCAALWRHNATIYRTDPRCVRYASLLVR